MLPTFLVIGAMKAGTTSMWRYLGAHPQVFVSSRKELHFFTHDRLDLHRYASWFEGAAGALAVGEASSSYTTYPGCKNVPARIARILPQARLIYIVREPIERMRSHYLHRVALGRERRPIRAALLEDPTYLETSRYASRIEEYLEHFPRENLLILRSEDLHHDRLATVQGVYRFLGVDENYVPPTINEEFYRTQTRRSVRPCFSAVWSQPTLHRLASHLPSPVVRLARRAATRRADGSRPVLHADLRFELEELLRADVRKLRIYMGPGFDGWGIA